MNRGTNHGGSEFASQIFAPDPLSRYQHELVHGAQQSRIPQEIRTLMMAVLEDGISCYRGYFAQPSRTNQKLHDDAEQWIMEDEEGVFSFKNICETLGLNSRQIRNALAHWKTTQLAERPPENTPNSWQSMRRRSRRKEAA